MTVLNAPVGLDATGQLVPGHPAGLAVWGDTDSSTLVCRQVQDITHDVRRSSSNRNDPRCSTTSPASS